MMVVRVRFYGPAKAWLGSDEAGDSGPDTGSDPSRVVELHDGATIADLRKHLLERHPDFRAALPTVRIAVNEVFVTDDTVLQPDDEVAIIPPVSGGSMASDPTIWINLVYGPIDAPRLREFVMLPPEGSARFTQGGIATFEGVVRDEVDPSHGRLVHLKYEAYESMARRQLRHLARRARAKWSAGRVLLAHRLDVIEPGQVAVMIAASCPHRADAFTACQWLIDSIKRDVPIWKKDVFEDGFVRWVEPSGPLNHAAD